jgi:hypothetical protein
LITINIDKVWVKKNYKYFLLALMLIFFSRKNSADCAAVLLLKKLAAPVEKRLTHSRNFHDLRVKLLQARTRYHNNSSIEINPAFREDFFTSLYIAERGEALLKVQSEFSGLSDEELFTKFMDLADGKSAFAKSYIDYFVLNLRLLQSELIVAHNTTTLLTLEHKWHRALVNFSNFNNEALPATYPHSQMRVREVAAIEEEMQRNDLSVLQLSEEVKTLEQKLEELTLKSQTLGLPVPSPYRYEAWYPEYAKAFLHANQAYIDRMEGRFTSRFP